MHRLLTLAVLGAALWLALAASAAGHSNPPAGSPPIKHVFVIVLENKNYVETFGANSKAPYFSGTLVQQGQLLTQYYAVTHLSLGNYIAMISGQASNVETQSDCQIFSNFVAFATDADGQAIGQGCVYPRSVETLAGQLTDRGLRWRGYMQDMELGKAGEPTTCRHPALNRQDDTEEAEIGDQYAARHNPFVYFHGLIDDFARDCRENNVPLTYLPADLERASRTPNFGFISPNLCEDGHDEPCVDGRPGGLVSADAFLKEWVPRITSSPAFKKDGLLMITFDEAQATGLNADASACCNQPPGPNTPNPGGPVVGPGGGRIGALLISPFIKAGTVNPLPYNHYAFLRTVEDFFSLPYLGYAGRPDLKGFGEDVFPRRR